MITSKQIVSCAMEGRSAGRAPRHLWTLPWAETNHPGMLKKISADYPDDIVNAAAVLKQTSPLTCGDPYAVGEYTDDWGCVFSNVHAGIIGEVKSPIVTDEEWEDVGNVHIPEEWLSFDVDEVNAWIRSRAADKFVNSGACPRPFEQLQFIRGTENLYVDLMFRPKKMMEFIEKMHDFYCRLLRKWAETDVDGLTFMDDWGSQNSLLINPELWKEIFMPMYRDYIDIAHKAGKKAFMHSDGNTLSIFPHLVDMGLDAINSQIFCIGVENLRQFRGKITFWGEIDRQHLLVKGSREDIRNAVRSVAENLWDGGHCIAQCEFGPGANPENVYEVFRAWNEFTA